MAQGIRHRRVVGEESNWRDSLPVTRLYVVSEGLTEANFVRDILGPHLESRWPERVTVQAPNLRGSCAYSELKKLVRALLGNPHGAVLVTTMIDLFKLPRDYPGSLSATTMTIPGSECRRWKDSSMRTFRTRGSYPICSFTSSKR